MQYLKDNQKNKIYLCVNYPFSNYEHVYYNNVGNETTFQEEGNVIVDAAHANLKKNIFDFVFRYTSESAQSINNISAVDLTKGQIRLPIAYKQGINFNYMIIAPVDNDGYNRTKIYYYAFIDAIEWSSNLESAVIHFHLDYWNTYIYRVDFFESYIEREHVNNDTFGIHTLDEGLTPGEFKVVAQTRKDLTGLTPLVAVGSTSHIFRSAPASVANRKQEHALWPTDNYGYNPILLGGRSDDSMQDIADVVAALTEANSADAIIGIYLLPKVTALRDTYIVKDLSPEAAGYGDNEFTAKLYNAYQEEEAINITKPTNPYGWQGGIKNAKTLTYPFCFLNVSNQLGNELTLKFEQSTAAGHKISLNKVTDANLNGAEYIYAVNYNGILDNLDYSISGLNYPTVPFIIDSYDSYIAANRNTIANSKNYIENDYNFKQGQITANYAVTRAVQSANDLASGISSLIGSGGNSFKGTAANILGNLAGSEFSHQTTMFNINASETLETAANDYTAEKARDSIKASLEDKANMPDKYCGRYLPNLLMCKDKPGFIIKTMVARPEELKAVDNYFTRYGYKVNTFEVPNLFIRTKFDYKKIIDANFTVEASTAAINSLKAIFNNGVTIWHTSTIDEIYDYTLSNSIR